MNHFEFFFTFYALLLGLALAEIMGGAANLLREQAKAKWGYLTPLLGLVLFVELMASFVDAWRKLQSIEIDLDHFAVPILIGVFYFFAATMLVPRRIEEWPSLDAYFFARRRWTIGALVAITALGWIIELPFSRQQAAIGLTPILRAYLLSNALLMALHLVALLSRRPRLVAAALVSIILHFLYYYSHFAASIFPTGYGATA